MILDFILLRCVNVEKIHRRSTVIITPNIANLKCP